MNPKDNFQKLADIFHAGFGSDTDQLGFGAGGGEPNNYFRDKLMNNSFFGDLSKPGTRLHS
jgi:hypothetical protein